MRPLMIFGGSVGRDLNTDVEVGLRWWRPSEMEHGPTQQKGGGVGDIKKGGEGVGEQPHSLGFPPLPPSPPHTQTMSGNFGRGFGAQRFNRGGGNGNIGGRFNYTERGVDGMEGGMPSQGDLGVLGEGGIVLVL